MDAGICTILAETGGTACSVMRTRRSSVVVHYGHRTNTHRWWERRRYSDWGMGWDGLSRKNGALHNVGQHIFPISIACRTTPGPTQPIIQRVSGILSRAVKQVKVKVTPDIP